MGGAAILGTEGLLSGNRGRLIAFVLTTLVAGGCTSSTTRVARIPAAALPTLNGAHRPGASRQVPTADGLTATISGEFAILVTDDWGRTEVLPPPIQSSTAFGVLFVHTGTGADMQGRQYQLSGVSEVVVLQDGEAGHAYSRDPWSTRIRRLWLRGLTGASLGMLAGGGAGCVVGLTWDVYGCVFIGAGAALVGSLIGGTMGVEAAGDEMGSTARWPPALGGVLLAALLSALVTAPVGLALTDNASDGAHAVGLALPVVTWALLAPLGGAIAYDAASP